MNRRDRKADRLKTEATEELYRLRQRGRDPDLARLKADSHASMMDKVEQLRKFRESEAASRRDRYGLISAYARHFRR